jgi:threonylcarbamoyladenosine tRNA methylthiotransferase MtaB
VIVGFPGETENDFNDTFDLCNEVDFSSLHVFPYSVRPGTSAQYFDLQVASDVKAIRMKRLINLTIDKRKSFRDRLIGKERLVLWEECSEIGSRLKWTGLTEDYLRVECFSDNRLHNQISKVKILSLNGEKLLVDLLNSSNES